MDKNTMIILAATAAGLYLAYTRGNDMVKGVATVVAGLVVAKQVPVINQAAA